MGAGVIAGYVLTKPPCSYTRDNLPGLSFIERKETFTCCNGIIIHSIPVLYYCGNDAWPVVLFCHGRGDDVGSLNIARLSHQLQANVVTFDYCGYGLHTTREQTEDACYLDALIVYRDYVLPLVKGDNKRVSVLGYSLGSAIATRLVFDLRHTLKTPATLILVSPLFSAASVITWMPMPGKIDCFHNGALAPQIATPTMIFHGQNDKTIPIACALALNYKFKNVVHFGSIPKCGHNGILYEPLVYNSIRNRLQQIEK